MSSSKVTSHGSTTSLETGLSRAWMKPSFGRKLWLSIWSGMKAALRGLPNSISKKCEITSRKPMTSLKQSRSRSIAKRQKSSEKSRRKIKMIG